MNVNTRAQSIMIREEIKVMLAQKARASSPNTQGVIVNWASWVSFHGSATSWAYSASKHAVVAMTKSATLSHAAQGIRCNAVAPYEQSLPSVGVRAETLNSQRNYEYPTGRRSEPGDYGPVSLL